jgi:FMN-dependent oxidoreductase (nitrilotriacetate monooxygenase family)
MTSPTRRLFFNAFSMNCVSHLNHGLWGRDDTRQTEYASLDPWIELAQILEKGRFDALFLADVVGVYDNYRGGPETSIREAMQVPVNDPTLLIPAMAAVTEHLGFAFTSSILSDHPYNFARRASTLDHLTKGRVAWNIVTSYLPGAAQNLGFGHLPNHDDRYDRGDDYLDVVYKLWEASWEDNAVVADPTTGVYADPDKVHLINHEGPYYTVPGPHLCEPSPQRTPLLFQAGTSERGREFAARHAECAFVTGSVQSSARIVADVRSRAVRYGRLAEDIKFFQALSPVVGGTEAEAKEKEAELRHDLSIEGGLAHMSGNMGADLGEIDLDLPLSEFDFNGVQGMFKTLVEAAPDKSWTFRDLARRQISGQFATGSPEQIVSRLEAYADVGIDGFNLIYATTPGTFVDFIEGVSPLLQKKGLMQNDYEQGPLRQKLFGQPRLPDRHPGAAHRR